MSRLNRPSGMQKAFNAGMPLFVLLLGSVYGIQTFLQTQIEIKDKKEQNTSVRVFSLDEEHKKLMKQLDIDNFSLSRIPRPGEKQNDDDDNTKKLKKVPKPEKD